MWYRSIELLICLINVKNVNSADGELRCGQILTGTAGMDLTAAATVVNVSIVKLQEVNVTCKSYVHFLQDALS